MRIKSQFLIKLYFFLVNGLVVQELFCILVLLIIDKPKNKNKMKNSINKENQNKINKLLTQAQNMIELVKKGGGQQSSVDYINNRISIIKSLKSDKEFENYMVEVTK